jgi:AcrR family transcriptional regulator
LHRTTPLERNDILDCALAIVQREGREAVSMRRLATELGVTPMAIYHHIPDKPALMSALVDRVWDVIVASSQVSGADPMELVIQNCINIRAVWLSCFDLASLAVAVADPDDAFYRDTMGMALWLEALGFPDVPLAYNAIQTVTMGSVQVAANRRAASAYFGRDPKASLAKARRLLRKHAATENHRGIVEARFDAGDTAYFEAALRALIAGLLTGN